MPLFSKKEPKKESKLFKFNPNIKTVKCNYVQKVKEYLGNDENLKIIFSRVWKMCDKCNRVYPEHYFWCMGCGSGRYLREFRIHNNLDELEKNGSKH